MYLPYHFNLNLNTKFCIYDIHVDSQAYILTVHEKIYPKKKSYYSKTKNDLLCYTFYFFWFNKCHVNMIYQFYLRNLLLGYWMVWFRLKIRFRDVIGLIFKCQGPNCFVLKVRDERNIFVKCKGWNMSFFLKKILY